MQSRNQIFDTLFRALAYLIGGIFLYAYTTSSTVDSATVQVHSLIFQVFGVTFMGFALFLVVAACVDRLSDWANRGHVWFGLGLFFVTLVRLAQIVIDTQEASFIVFLIIFLIALIGAFLCHICKGCICRKKRTQGKP